MGYPLLSALGQQDARSSPSERLPICMDITRGPDARFPNRNQEIKKITKIK